MSRRVPVVVVVGLFGALCVSGATCEQQDFASVGEVLEVSSSQGTLSARLREPVTHDVVTRHALDYAVENTGAETVEVVVEATSEVDGRARASGRAVLRLDAGGSAHGRIPDLQLEVGNGLDLALQCCAASQCGSTEMLCPTSSGDPALAADPGPAFVCLDGCDRVDACPEGCATTGGCVEACEDDADAEACLARCTSECVATCERETATCAANCLAFYRRCHPQMALSEPGSVPCALCGDGASGLCASDALGCAPGGPQAAWNCFAYPAVCMTECTSDALFDPADRAGRYQCLESCVRVHQTACNLDVTGIDARVTAPCCYAEACEARLEAVVKLDAVECYMDADCGTQRRCNARGICENRLREEQTGCQVVSPRLGADRSGAGALPWLAGLVAALLLVLRSRRRRRRGAAGLAGAGALVLLLVLVMVAWPGEASAEPRRFRLTRSTFVVGVTSGTFLVGELGGATGAGLGLSAQQTISSGYFGGSVRIGASVYPSDHEGLVFDQGLQTYFLAAGPRLVIPTFDELELFVFVQPEYVLEGLQSNALVELTGDTSVLHGPAGQLGLQLALDPLALELSGGFGWVFPADAGQLTVTLGVGFTGIL